MTISGKQLLAAVAAIVVMALTVSIWHDHRRHLMEKDIETQRQAAVEAEKRSLTHERAAVEYKKKIEYLEEMLADIEGLAAIQNEELKELEKNTNDARDRAVNARSVRNIRSSSDELCRKLYELGHSCRQQDH